MPTAWADLDLCTVEDVRVEVRDGEVPLLATTGDAPATAEFIRLKIARAKEELYWKLNARVRDLYADRSGEWWYSGTRYATAGQWLQARGYTEAQLDGWEDRIINPEALKLVCVAYTVRLMLRDGLLRQRSNYEGNTGVLDAPLGIYEKECHERLETAIRSVQIDLDDDDVTDVSDRLRTRVGTFWRS